LHIDVLEICNFNCTKVKTTLSSVDGINCGKFWPLDFLIITILDDQLCKQKIQLLEKKNYKMMNNAFLPPAPPTPKNWIGIWGKCSIFKF